MRRGEKVKKKRRVGGNSNWIRKERVRERYVEGWEWKSKCKGKERRRGQGVREVRARR